MFCSNCGTKNRDRAKFCSVCGAQLFHPEEVAAFLSSEAANAAEKAQAVVKDGKARNKFYHSLQNEKIYKYIQMGAEALYIIVFLVFFSYLTQVSIQDNQVEAELKGINAIISVVAYKIFLYIFLFVQEGLVLFAHIKQNYICALALVGTMLLHTLLFGIGIATIIWIACGAFFAVQLFKFDKMFRAYCRNEENS